MGMFDIKPVKISSPKIPSARTMLPRKRDIQRVISNKRIREPISAALAKKVLTRAKNTCEHKGCRVKNSEFKLQFHHKDMRNDNNTLSNIIVLCPNHHWLIHKNNKVMATRDVLGNRVLGKVVTKAKRDQLNKAKKNSSPWGFNGL